MPLWSVLVAGQQAPCKASGVDSSEGNDVAEPCSVNSKPDFRSNSEDLKTTTL